MRLDGTQLFDRDSIEGDGGLLLDDRCGRYFNGLLGSTRPSKRRTENRAALRADSDRDAILNT